MERHNNKKEFPSAGFNQGGFEVPEGYFEQLPDRIMKKISGRESSKRKSYALHHRVITLSAAAAVFLLLIATGLWYRYHTSSLLLPGQKEITAYYTDEIEIGEQDLYDFIDTQNIEITHTIQDVDDETIITYLLDEGIDNETIEKQL